MALPHLKDIDCQDEISCEAQYEQVCEIVTTGSNIPQLSIAFDGEAWFSVLLYTSGLISGLFFIVTWQNKELQSHPMKIFMHLALAESIIPMCSALVNQICQLNLDNLFAQTVFFQTSTESLLKAVIILGAFSQFIIVLFCINVNLLLACLCFDLI